MSDDRSKKKKKPKRQERYNMEGMTDAHEHVAQLCAAYLPSGTVGDTQWSSVLDNTKLLTNKDAIFPQNRLYLADRKGKFRAKLKKGTAELPAFDAALIFGTFKSDNNILDLQASNRQSKWIASSKVTVMYHIE